MVAQEDIPSSLPERTTSEPLNKDPFGGDLDKDSGSFQAKFMHMLFLLGLIIAFMLLASYMLKRLNRSRVEQLNTSSTIRVREARMISARSTIYLIEIEGKGLVIAESPTSITHLTTISLKEE